MTEETKKIIKQNEVIISLLGRLAFKPEDIRKIVTSKKQNPDNYIKGYNACTGEKTLSDIAAIIGVTPGTLSPILSEWEELGIIYAMEKPKGRFYRKIFPI
jgi:DNA-binding MarR family transcriptional regulator